MKYRKKPIEVEAFQFTEENKNRVLSWAQSIQANVSHGWEDGKPCLIVPTLEGEMICSLGDYLIREPFPTDWRKIYPCKPDIFEATYSIESAPSADPNNEVLTSLSELIRTCSRLLNKGADAIETDGDRLENAKTILAKYSDKNPPHIIRSADPAPRCEYEKHIIEYFGLPEDVSFDKVPKVTYADLVDLVLAWHQKSADPVKNGKIELLNKMKDLAMSAMGKGETGCELKYSINSFIIDMDLWIKRIKEKRD